MINPLLLHPNTSDQARANFQKRWDKKQARIKAGELKELDHLLKRAENHLVMSAPQKARLVVLTHKYATEEVPK